MKYFGLLSVCALLLVSCGNFEMNETSVMSSYRESDRSLNLEDKDISGFVNLNKLSGDTEIVNIYLGNNGIERLNISEYSDLGRLDISSNRITFLANIAFPLQIRHLVLADNGLRTLDGIEELKELKTLDIRNNNLDEEDLAKLADLPDLALILADGNQGVSNETLQKLSEFNGTYLSRIKQ